MANEGGCLTYSVKEAAKLIGIGRNQMYAAVATGDVRAIRVGGRILIPRVVVQQMIYGEHAPHEAA